MPSTKKGTHAVDKTKPRTLKEYFVSSGAKARVLKADTERYGTPWPGKDRSKEFKSRFTQRVT